METVNVGIESRRLTIELLETLNDDICSICQAAFRVREHLLGLGCGHGYHRDCFIIWAREVGSKA